MLGGGDITGSEIKFLYPASSSNPGSAHFSIYNSGNGMLTFADTDSSNATNIPPTRVLMVLTGNGNDGKVGIGLTSPTYKLDVAGDINTSSCFRTGVTTVSGTCTSDTRLKENIQDYSAGLAELLGIRVRTYQFNGLGEMPRTGETAVGVIAQEVEQTNPGLVKTRMVKMHPEDIEKTEIKAVDYSKFIYMLINAVKELHGKSVGVQDHQAAQDRQIASKADKAETEALRAENAALKAWVCKKDPSAPFCRPFCPPSCPPSCQ